MYELSISYSTLLILVKEQQLGFDNLYNVF